MLKLFYIHGLIIFFLTPLSEIFGSEHSSAGVSLAKDVGLMWIIISAGLVFFMQAGFLMLESGLVRAKNTINVAIKNLSDFVIGSLLFFSVGFGLMFGTGNGLTGSDLFFLTNYDSPQEYAFFIYQVAFMATAATITSGAVAERMKFGAYVIITVAIAVVIYPVYGHWTWGGGWLSRLGFVDFAGSTVVHSLGGWVALAGVVVLGPRKDKFDENGQPQTLIGHNLPAAVLGVIILWFGWIGFNGGSTLNMTDEVPLILINTVLAGSAGGLGGLILTWIIDRKPQVDALLNGVLGGLVGITAGCNLVSPPFALAIGLVSGGVVYFTSKLMEHHLKLDDVIMAFPVHGACGVWGTLAVALFSNSPDVKFTTQLIGVGVCAGWAFLLGLVVFFIVKVTIGIRVSSEDEEQGLNFAEHGARTTWLDLVNSMKSIAQGGGDLSQRIAVEPGTESGAVAELYNRIIDRLAALVGTVKDQAFELQHSAKELSSASGSIGATVDEQSTQMTGIAGQVDRFRESIDLVSGRIEEQNKESTQVHDLTQKLSSGFKLLGQGLNESAEDILAISTFIRENENQLGGTVDNISKLRDTSEQIGGLVDILSGLSNHLNLLSINASIEAARSGAAGKGFSVVALEINNLSEQTAQNTTRAGEYLNHVQNSIDASVTEMRRSLNNFLRVIPRIKRISDTLGHLKNTGNQFDSFINRVAENIKQNTEVTNHVAASMATRVDDIAELNRQIASMSASFNVLSTQAEELYATSQNLSTRGSELMGQVDKFRLDERREIN